MDESACIEITLGGMSRTLPEVRAGKSAEEDRERSLGARYRETLPRNKE